MGMRKVVKVPKRPNKKTRDIPWEQIREVYTSGLMGITKIAEHMDISINTIKSRMQREKWEKPAKIVDIEDVNTLLQEKVLDQIPPVYQSDIIAETKRLTQGVVDLHAQANEYQKIMGNKALQMAIYIQGMSPAEVLKRALAIEKVDNIARRTLGLDKVVAGDNGNLIINLNVLKNSDPKVIDIEAEKVKVREGKELARVSKELRQGG